MSVLAQDQRGQGLFPRNVKFTALQRWRGLCSRESVRMPPKLDGLRPESGCELSRSRGIVDKILKGAKLADLPAEQPTRFELILNLKSAKLLGLDVPSAIMPLADEVIE